MGVSKICVRWIAYSLAAAVAGSTAFAADDFFTDNDVTDSLWTTPGNWSLAAAPGGGDRAVINGGNAALYTAAAGLITIADLQIGSSLAGGDGAGSGSLTISGGDFRVANNTFIGELGGAHSGTLTITGGIIRATPITIRGSGTLQWSDGDMVNGVNGLDPNIVLNEAGATLRYFGTGAYDMDNSIFNVNANATIIADGGDRLTLSNGNINVTGNPTLTLSGTGTANLSKSLASGGGAANLVKNGAGTWILTNGSNAYAGTTTVNDGILRLHNNGFTPGDFTVNAGATLEVRIPTANVGGGVFSLDGGGTFLKTGAFEATQSSAGSTVAMSSGALFHIQEGTYRFGAGGIGDWSGNRSDLQVDGGATFRGAASPIVVGALTGGGTVTTGGGLTVGVDNGSGLFTGAIVNDPNFGSDRFLTKEGTGTQTLAGANTYTGATTVNSGTLRIGNGGTTGSIDNTSGVAVNAPGALAFNRSNNYLYGGGAITGGGTIAQIGGGTTVIAADHPGFTGAVSVSNGTLQLGNGGATGSFNSASSATVSGTGILAFNNGGGATFAPQLAGNGVVNNDAGDVTLTNAGNSFTGRFNVNAGTLATAVPGAMGDPSRVHLATGATFDLTGAAVGGVINGSGSSDATNTTYSGTGTIETGGNDFQWNSGVTIAPGNSPGVINVGGGGALLWNGATGGGTYNWEVFDGTGAPTGGSGTGWDLINVTGSLDLTGGSGTIVAIGLSGTGPDVAGLPNNVNMDPGFSPKETTFEIIRTTAGITGLTSFSPTFVNQMNHPGYFDLYSNGFSLFLVWIPTPEPGTWALFALLLAGGLFAVRRKAGQPQRGASC